MCLGGIETRSSCSTLPPGRGRHSTSWSAKLLRTFSAEIKTKDVNPAREAFLTAKAKELGFSVEELKSAIAAWTNSVEDPYNKGLGSAL